MEAQLGPIPVEFRRFLLEATPEDWRNFQGVSHGVEEFIRENTRFRRWPEDYQIIQPDDSAVPWPAGWWVVSDNGGGDHWFVRDEDGGRSVWFWNHESWEAREVAPTIADFLTEGRERREENARPVVTFDHPTLGPVEFTGSSYELNGPIPVFVQVGWLHADPAAQRAVLDTAAPLIARGVAGERLVFEAALPQLFELQHEPVSWRPNLPKLSAEQIRERLTCPSLNIHAERSGDGFDLKLNYVYNSAGSFAWDYLEIECGPDLTVCEVGPL